jgi:tight adherence protein B
LHQQILIAALGSTILFGLGLVWVRRAERRKIIIEPRLKALAKRTSNTDSAVVSLRRPLPQRTALPAVLLSRLDAALAATGNRITQPYLAASTILAAAAVGLAATVVQSRPVFSVASASIAAIGAPVLLVRFAQRRNQRRFLETFPDALDLIVRAVRTGLPVIEAIEMAAREIRAPVGIEFERMLGEIRIGVEMGEALQHAADRIRVPDFRFFVVSLLLQQRTGGSIAETLSKLSSVIRQRKALRMKARALTAEATASAAVVGTMPLIAGVGLFLISREVMSVLFVDPRGRFMLGVAAVGLLLGIGVMKAMIKKSLQ